MKMSHEQEREILADPATRRLVHEVVQLAQDRDPVDAVADLELALRIMEGRLERLIRRQPPVPF